MIKRIPNLLFYLLLALLVAGAVSLVIAYIYHYKVMDVVFWVGLILAMVGAMSSIIGNPTGSRFLTGGIDSQAQSNVNIETLQMERKITQYSKTFKKHAVFDPKVSSVSIIFSGVILILISYLSS